MGRKFGSSIMRRVEMETMNKRCSGKFKGRQGFTLAEVLVVLSLLSLLSVFFLRCFFFVAEQQQQHNARLELEDNLMIAASLLAEDISRSTAVLGCESQELVLQQTKTIYYNLGEDQQASAHVYPLEGKILYRREHTQQSRQPMANFISDMVLTYFDKDGEKTTDADRVCAVEFVLEGYWREMVFQQRQIVRLEGVDYL